MGKQQLCAFAAVLAGFMGIITSAQAQISINGVSREFTAKDRPVENVIVYNNSPDAPFVVNVEVSKLENVSKDNERRVPSKELLIAPGTFLVQPDSSKKIRMVLRNPPGEEERVYRVRFFPKVPDEDFSKSALNVSEDEAATSVQTGVKVITSMGMLVRVAPREMKPKLTWERDAGGILFKNEGNVSIDMRRRMNFCFAENDCRSLPGNRIYPGETWYFEIPGNKPLTYYYGIYGDIKKADIAPL